MTYLNTKVTMLAHAWQSAATLFFLSHTPLPPTHTQSAYNHTHTQNSQPHMQREYSNFTHFWMCVSLPSGLCNSLYIGFVVVVCLFVLVRNCLKGNWSHKFPLPHWKKQKLVGLWHIWCFAIHSSLIHDVTDTDSWAKNGSTPVYILCNFLTSVFIKLDQKYGE